MAKGRTTIASTAKQSPARSHTVRVVDHLGQAIVSGRLPQGKLLPGDQDLLAEYGVSRTVIREALRTLSAKGLLHARARVGTRVQPRSSWNLFDPEVLRWHRDAGLDPDFLRHLAEVRMGLEPEAAALAATNRSDADIAAINGWVSLMDKPGIKHEDFARADLGFHLAVAQAAGNPFFVTISTLIEVVLEAMLTISSPAANSERHAESVAQHRGIASAIAERDAIRARRAMQAVIQKGIDATGRPTPAE